MRSSFYSFNDDGNVDVKKQSNIFRLEYTSLNNIALICMNGRDGAPAKISSEKNKIKCNRPNDNNLANILSMYIKWRWDMLCGRGGGGGLVLFYFYATDGMECDECEVAGRRTAVSLPYVSLLVVDLLFIYASFILFMILFYVSSVSSVMHIFGTSLGLAGDDDDDNGVARLGMGI